MIDLNINEANFYYEIEWVPRRFMLPDTLKSRLKKMVHTKFIGKMINNSN